MKDIVKRKSMLSQHKKDFVAIFTMREIYIKLVKMRNWSYLYGANKSKDGKQTTLIVVLPSF